MPVMPRSRRYGSLSARLAKVPVSAPRGEVNARVFNTAGEVVDRESWYYLAGGIESETINVSRWAPGVYIIVIDGLAKSGLPGLYCAQTGVRRKTLKETFVVRR